MNTTKIKEHQIEQNFINKLIELKYTYREDIRDRQSLEHNFRDKFNSLNRVNLSDAEFNRLLEQIITPNVFKSAKILRERNSFERDDGTPLHFTLVNIKDWCKNSFEVINQLRMTTDNSFHRYDVILLINGIPTVQIELKTLDISPRRAMQQIIEYKNDIGNGYAKSLMSFLQLFIVSNQHKTLYFANNNAEHFNFDADERFLPIYEYADKENYPITNLHDFTTQFLSKCTLGEMISRYMVLVVSEQKLMMMRPYQIYAVEAIVESIHQNRGNGYIWHTTGSGKTLTSFKASTLLKDNPDIEKCLFVVDRKDLDRQTREEFNKFQEGSVEENTNTETLVNRLLSTSYSDKIIVTTIQKLGLALDGANKNNYKKLLEPLRDSRIVFIFDECHRSQFGENHQAIKSFFPKAQLFGFTGTPIFKENATYKQIDGEEASMKTTDDVFENRLHAYTITNAIDDKNVLRFHVDYFKPDGKTKLKEGDIITQKAIIEAILDKHHAATSGRKFNAVLATASINHAIEYHRLFSEIQTKRLEEDESFSPLNIACVFSPPAEGNKDVKQLQEDLDQERQDNEVAPNEKKEALKNIITAYNSQYGTSHTINNFDSYYQDIQQRIKDHKYPNSDHPQEKKIDIVIVVDMLLTGFDSKYLNTLYVDKNLKHHGLIQAFSRTNRVLNDTKPYGNILDFRGQEASVNEAITLFSGKSSKPAKEIWLVDAAPIVIGKLEKVVNNLDSFMQSQGLSMEASDVAKLRGDKARIEFVNIFKEIQRLKTQLDQYTDLDETDQQSIQSIMPLDSLRAFKGVYIDIAKDLKAQQDHNGDVSSDIDQLDFEFVLFASAMIDYDFIMSLITRYAAGSGKKQKMSKAELIALIASDAKFMNEREDITEYIESLEVGGGLSETAIREGYEAFKMVKSSHELDKIALKHQLEVKALHAFVQAIFDRMIFDAEALSDLMAPLNLGWKERAKRETALMDELIPLLKKQAGEQEISGLSTYE